MRVVFLNSDSTEIVTLQKDYQEEGWYNLREALLDFSRMQKINYVVSEVYEKFGDWKVLLSTEGLQSTDSYYAVRFNNPKTIKELCLVHNLVNLEE